MFLKLPYFLKKYSIQKHLKTSKLNSHSVIAIDGYASTGKSTISKMLSLHFQIPFIDSGAFYRGITLFALKKGFINNDKLDQSLLKDALDTLNLSYDTESGNLYLNGKNVSNKIRLPDVSDNVSLIAGLTFVRKFLLRQLRNISSQNGLVMDGRDIGTVVFPNAEYKFFFSARPEVRARRRYEELKTKGQNSTFQEVLNNIILRDETDISRDIAPLKKANDAFEIDTSDLSTEEVFEILLKKIKYK